MNSLKGIFSINEVRRFAEASSIWFYSTGSSCCANEMVQTQSCRYDLERLGVVEKHQPEQADLLIVYGAVSRKAAPALLDVYRRMRFPKRVMAVGACACGGAFFDKEPSLIIEIEELFPVDVFVPGCPPRPEAIMNGFMKLKDKILTES